MSLQPEDQLLETANDGNLKTTFETITLLMIWVKIKLDYAEFATIPLKRLLPFPTSYSCDVGFSVMTATKTKPRNRLDIRDALQVSLTDITPRWEGLILQIKRMFLTETMW